MSQGNVCLDIFCIQVEEDRSEHRGSRERERESTEEGGGREARCLINECHAAMEKQWVGVDP